MHLSKRGTVPACTIIAEFVLKLFNKPYSRKPVCSPAAGVLEIFAQRTWTRLNSGTSPPKPIGNIMSWKLVLPIALFSSLIIEGRADDFFVRPIICEMNPHVVDGAKATGWGACAGYYWQDGPTDAMKELSIEFERAKWDGSLSGSGGQGTANETVVPVLANLRVIFTPDDRFSMLRMYFGPCIGFMSAAARIDLTGGGQTTSLSSSDFDFAWGGTAGIQISIIKKLDIDIGYRILGTTDTKFQFDGQKLRTGKYTIDGWFIGVGTQF